MFYCKHCIHFEMCKFYRRTVDYAVDDGACLHFAKDTNVLTNADRIRAMSDEELAEVLGELVHCGGCPMRGNCNVDDLPCDNVLLEWLKQPVEDKNEN